MHIAVVVAFDGTLAAVIHRERTVIMNSHLPRLAPNAVAVFIASAFLAGCAGAANVTPSQGGGLGANLNSTPRVVAQGFTHPNITKNTEKLTSTSGKGEGEMVFVSGKARGPYPGTFTGAGFFTVQRPYDFSGNFTITSGANNITGTFLGSGFGGCFPRNHYCGGGGKMTYQATLEPGGKTFSGKGNVLMKAFADGTGSMDITLYSM